MLSATSMAILVNFSRQQRRLIGSRQLLPAEGHRLPPACQLQSHRQARTEADPNSGRLSVSVAPPNDTVGRVSVPKRSGRVVEGGCGAFEFRGSDHSSASAISAFVFADILSTILNPRVPRRQLPADLL